MPVPVFVKEPPVPVMSPENVVLVLVPPEERLWLPRLMAPEPAIEPTVSLAALSAKVPLALTVTAVVSAKALAVSNWRVPVFTVVLPV